MLWTIAASFFDAARPHQRWLDDYLGGGGDRFRKVAPPVDAQGGWHSRSARATPLGGWRRHWRHSAAALKGTDGLVTLFPQLALTAAIQRDLFHRRVPIVAWCFNIGAFPTGPRARVSRLALRRIERFVVHSTAEVSIVREWLGLEEGAVQFVPLQRAPIPALEEEERDAPFAVAMGSANRDYRTLIEAAARAPIPLTIVAAPRAVEGLAIPPNVTLRSGLSPEQCWRLAQRARFSVVPLADTNAASGQVTVIEAMRMDRPVIATRSAGTVDYVEDGSTGLLVAPSDPDALGEAMRRLWDDGAERARLAANASAFAEEQLSDEAAAKALARVLEEAKAARNR